MAAVCCVALVVEASRRVELDEDRSGGIVPVSINQMPLRSKLLIDYTVDFVKSDDTEK